MLGKRGAVREDGVEAAGVTVEDVLRRDRGMVVCVDARVRSEQG